MNIQTILLRSIMTMERVDNLRVNKRLVDALHSCDNSTHRKYIIGGASIYEEALTLKTKDASPVVDRILLTRILSPSFEECNVFFPEFRDTDKILAWRRSSHQELVDWLGFEVTEGIIEEKGIEYELQMWTRINPDASKTF